MTLGVAYFTNRCFEAIPKEIPAQKKAFLRLTLFDGAIACTALVLFILSFTGILSLPPAAKYSLMMVGVAFIALDVTALIDSYRKSGNIYIRKAHLPYSNPFNP